MYDNNIGYISANIRPFVISEIRYRSELWMEIRERGQNDGCKVGTNTCKMV